MTTPRPRLLALAALVLACGFPAVAGAATTGVTVIGQSRILAAGDEVVGDLNVVNARVVCENGAVIDGDVKTYFGEFVQEDGCIVRGAVVSSLGSSSTDAVVPWLVPPDTSRIASVEGRHLAVEVGSAIIALLMFLLFPLRTRIALERVERHPGLSAAVGTLAAVAVVPIAVLLAITIVGIPLILIEVAAVFGLLWIGQAAVALLIGRRLSELVRPHATPTPLGALLVGLALVIAAELLPSPIDWVVTAIVWLVGLGCAILAFVRERSFASFLRPPLGPGAPTSESRGTPPAPGVPMKLG